MKVFVDEGLWGMKCVSAALPPCAIYILQPLNLALPSCRRHGCLNILFDQVI